MANFKCNNPECPKYEEEVEYRKWGGKHIKGEFKHVDSKGDILKCPECESELVKVPTNKGFCTGHSLFNSKSKEQKKEILKKRADHHFNRNTGGMKEYKEAADNYEI